MAGSATLITKTVLAALLLLSAARTAESLTANPTLAPKKIEAIQSDRLPKRHSALTSCLGDTYGDGIIGSAADRAEPAASRRAFLSAALVSVTTLTASMRATAAAESRRDARGANEGEGSSPSSSVASADPPPTHAVLEWAGGTPSFCGQEGARIDLRKIRATPETIGAIFGSRDPGVVRVFDERGNRLETWPSEEDSVRRWPLDPGGRYFVDLGGVPSSGDAPVTPPCSFRDIYALLGDDAEATVRRLSLEFYRGVWSDESDAEFRSLFVRAVASPEEAADNQARWLMESWGGPTRYTEKYGEGKVLTRTMAKHSSRRRMNFRNAEAWLVHMERAVSKVLGGRPAGVRSVIGLYWAHFFAFFPFSEEERAAIRRITSREE